MKFADIRIVNKMALGFATVIVIFVMICLFLILGMNTLKNLEDASARRTSHAIETAEIGMLVDGLYSIIADSIINRNIVETENKVTIIKNKIKNNITKTKEAAESEEDKELALKIEREFSEVLDIFELEMLKDFQLGTYDLNKVQSADSRIGLLRQELDTDVAKFIQKITADTKKSQAAFDSGFKRLATLAVILSLIGVLLGIFFAYINTKAITAPIIKGLEFARLLAKGNFLERIDLDQKDELGQLANALNTSADNLEKLISEIIIASQNLVRAVEEIASGNENLSQRTSEQASSLEEIAATVEQTNASTKQNYGNAREANTLAESSSRLAVDGGQIVEKAVVSIGEINNSSKQISEIINMINEISFQTNLLALNAAVEAARAGEQGRGFAVVAGEVRNLSQRSAGAAKEIGALIKDSIGKINEGTDLVNKSGEALKDIILSTKQVKDIIAEISASSDEQSKGIEQINIAVTEMDTMTQQNAALVEQTAAASEEMSNQAQELLAMVQQFKIRENLIEGVKGPKHKEIHIHQLQAKPVHEKPAADKKSAENVIPEKHISDRKTPEKQAQEKQPEKEFKPEKYNPEQDGYEKF